jgi:hypothetical protein
MTVTANEEELAKFMKEEFKDVPEWALKIHHRGVEGVSLRLWSAWGPDFKWLEGLLTKYPSSWVKNSWHEEGGYEGVWVGFLNDGETNIKRLEWDGMCLEEADHRFRGNIPEKFTYHILNEQGATRFTSDELASMMKFQDKENFGVKWCMRIESIGFERVEEFPDFKDPKVRKAFQLDDE